MDVDVDVGVAGPPDAVASIPPSGVAPGVSQAPPDAWAGVRSLRNACLRSSVVRVIGAGPVAIVACR